MARVVREVEVDGGPMSAGKTSSLFGHMGALAAIGVRLVAIQPAVDVRDSGVIRPKNLGLSAQGSNVPSNCIRLRSLLDLTSDHLQGAQVVAIDEFTLFGFDANRDPIPDHYRQVMDHLAGLGVVAVYAAGLSVAANRTIMPLLAGAIANGANVRLLAARCMVPVNGPDAQRCGEVARSTIIHSIATGVPYHTDTLPTLLPQRERPDLGYMPVCPHHLAVADTIGRDFQLDYPES